jgi:hypothetical protein
MQLMKAFGDMVRGTPAGSLILCEHFPRLNTAKKVSSTLGFSQKVSSTLQMLLKGSVTVSRRKCWHTLGISLTLPSKRNVDVYQD